jgi:DUF917 family protein
MLRLNEQYLEWLVYGGAVMGAGGGGSIQAGLEAGRQALAQGAPRLAKLAELSPRDRIVTFSTVGSVGGSGSVNQLDGQHTRAWKLFITKEHEKISGFIPSEVGPLAVTYGWRESSLTGLPVVDAPCNGRAHPLGMMGSLGLHRRRGHLACMAAVGGRAGRKDCVELFIVANVVRASRIVRQTAAELKTPLAVIRNPLPASYVRRHAAVGGLAYAGRVGRVFLQNRKREPLRMLQSLCDLMGGRIAGAGKIQAANISERGGFTVGNIFIHMRNSDALRLPVCNEYLIVLQGGAILAAFPDLITLFDLDTRMPLISAEVKPGMRVAVLVVPKARLPLGSPMHDTKLLRPLEKFLEIEFPGPAAVNAVSRPTESEAFA